MPVASRQARQGSSRRNKSEYDTLMGRGAPERARVSFMGPSGVRHSVDVIAESIYEAAALGVSALKNGGWADATAPGTELEVQVREPATSHRLTVLQIRRWCDGVAVSPDETLRSDG